MNRCSYQCYDNETCDPFFGNCSRCADGYKNAKCDESKSLIASLFCLKKKTTKDIVENNAMKDIVETIKKDFYK